MSYLYQFRLIVIIIVQFLMLITQASYKHGLNSNREGTKDEGTHSSSGNWSASSSTRTSVESDQQRPLVSPTSSYEQDSVPSE